MLVAASGAIAPRAHAAKKLPPIAEPMYLSAFANVITGHPNAAVRTLNHLAIVDPTMAVVHNALALALFTAEPGDHQRALVHAMRAVALAPDVPQFVVTRVLTDRRNWHIDANGTARLTRGAALMLRASATVLMTGGERERDLGRLLDTTEAPQANSDFPFVLPGYAALVANPKLAFTRPNKTSFVAAQKAIARNVAEIRGNHVAQRHESLRATRRSEPEGFVTAPRHDR